jgi:hypothetical protein
VIFLIEIWVCNAWRLSSILTLELSQGIILEEAKGLKFPLPLGTAANQQVLLGELFVCVMYNGVYNVYV